MPRARADQPRPAPAVANAAFDLVGLTALMQRTAGQASVSVALIDGPVTTDAPSLENEHIHGATAIEPGAPATRRARAHAARVAGILMGSRSGPAPGICPDCTMLVHPVLQDDEAATTPRATHEALADAILAAVDAKADIVNLSVGLRGRSVDGERRVHDALDHAMRQGVLVVAAAGNESRVGGSVLTRHPWVVPVAAYGRDASPLTGSNLGWSIGMRGLGAPGEDVLTLGRSGKPVRTSGTSIATPIVAGAAALIWSAFPSAPAAEVRRALVGPLTHRRSIAPPLLAAEAAYQRLSAAA